MKKLKRTVRPIRLDTKTWRYVEPILRASQAAQSETGRFKYYGYLVIVFRTYIRWKHLGISKRLARQVARSFETPQRRTTTPIRTLIDATFPSLNSKQKSRWTRALELAAVAKTRPDQLVMLFRNYSGIAGCARLAADQKPKKNTYRDDWAANPTYHDVRKNCDFNGFGNDA
jgi:hypothetical protein